MTASRQPRAYQADTKLPAVTSVPWTVWDATLVLLLTFLIPAAVYLLILFLAHLGLVPVGVGHFLTSASPVNETVSYLISLVVELSLLSWILRKYGLGWRAFGLRGFRFWRAVGLVVGFYVAFVILIGVVFILVKTLIPAVNVDQAQQTGFEGAHQSWQLILGFVVIVLAAPFLEEMYFRGFLFPALAKKWRPIGGAIISSAIFGLLHFQANISIYTFVLGLFLCYLYIKLRSVVPGMFLHMLNNLIAFLVLFKLI